MDADTAYERAKRQILLAYGFVNGEAPFLYVPWQVDFEVSIFDFAQSLGLNRAGCPSTVSLEGSEPTMKRCGRFELIVTDLQPVAWPDLQKSSGGTLVYSPNPSWVGQGSVVVSPDARPVTVRFAIEVCEEADRGQIFEIGFDFFTP